MNLDDFENRLRHTPLRPVPPTWRAEILAAARSAASTAQPHHAANRGSWPTVLEWLWPHPKAWAGLAACWVAVFVLNTAAAPNAVERAQSEAGATTAAAYFALLRQPDTSSPNPRLTPSPADRPRPSRPDRTALTPDDPLRLV